MTVTTMRLTKPCAMAKERISQGRGRETGTDVPHREKLVDSQSRTTTTTTSLCTFTRSIRRRDLHFLSLYHSVPQSAHIICRATCFRL